MSVSSRLDVNSSASKMTPDEMVAPSCEYNELVNAAVTPSYAYTKEMAEVSSI